MPRPDELVPPLRTLPWRRPDALNTPMPIAPSLFRTQVIEAPFETGSALTAQHWQTLLDCDGETNPFMRHAYLQAMDLSGSATVRTGWSPHGISLWQGEVLHGACIVYLKPHSYGEYVFDWAWANAYAEHGLNYYPKAVLAVPFTPVPGPRLLARSAEARAALVRALVGWCKAKQLSSLHLLFGHERDLQACEAAGLMLRHTVQFHWQNSADGYGSFDDFLSHLAQDKRKKIRQERRKVTEAGVVFRHAQGSAITDTDWDFFYRCYERTYLEHGNAPYLSRDFFNRMAQTMPENWLLFTAEREGRPIATSLIALNALPAGATGINALKVAYGR